MTAWVKTIHEVWSNHTGGGKPATEATKIAEYPDRETAQAHADHVTKDKPGEFIPPDKS